MIMYEQEHIRLIFKIRHKSKIYIGLQNCVLPPGVVNVVEVTTRSK
jgi:hypothetical protein